MINQFTSEVDYLRSQIDKQTHHLAVWTARNGDMVKKIHSSLGVNESEFRSDDDHFSSRIDLLFNCLVFGGNYRGRFGTQP